jgi:plasmid stabilization system protein ParE
MFSNRHETVPTPDPGERDLVEILRYLRSVNPAAAGRFLTALDRRLMLLATQPYSGHSRPDLNHDEYRYITFAPYLIAYYPDSKPLAIAAILHASQDLRLIFSQRT